MKSFKLALFTDSAPQFLEASLKRACQAQSIDLTLYSYPFTSPLAVAPKLAEVKPDAVLLWFATEVAQQRGFTELEPIVATLPYSFLVANAVAIEDGTCGNNAAAEPTTLRSRTLAWNHSLADLARTRDNVSILDLDLLQSLHGRAKLFDARLWESMSIALTPAACDLWANSIATTIAARLGALHKVLVTDLDGTLWQGIAGEGAVQPEAPGFLSYQHWLKTLQARGIFLAIASKNDLAPVEQAFATPGNLLTLKDFAAVEISWQDKPTLLQQIAKRLNVGLDSLVFIDDLPEQRAAVRAALPMVCVPEIPADPAQRVEQLAQMNLFEVPRLTEADTLRATQQAATHARQALAQTLSPEDWIASLEQVLTPEPLGPTNLARAAQLSQRCNQFNLCANRFTEQELSGLSGYLYRLMDKFGDLGAISLVVLRDREIIGWFMSCRVFERGLEEKILQHLQASGPICGHYVASERNSRCCGLLQRYSIPATL